MLDIDLHLDGRIGDIEQLEIDFANHHVGFGSTDTQEELILDTSPESCVIVLANEVLEANEATGARRYGDYSGYGRQSRYTGPCQDTWDWSQRTILAIDTISCPQDQLGHVTMSRELCKAWTGFRSELRQGGQYPLATGAAEHSVAIPTSSVWSRSLPPAWPLTD